jgi:2-polyprenyl-3-methyl-5-hydroxy-6-metoxy-1,4-benzoquinol methylase
MREFVHSAEFRLHQLAPGGPLGNPFDGLPSNPIQFDLSAEQRESLWRRIGQAWSHFGREDPYFSVLTSDEFHLENMSAAAIERFYNSGEADVQRAENFLARHGRELPKDGICADYGCGLGRMTLWLAQRCKRVLAIDVSEAHLNIAREKLAARGIFNVEYHLLRHHSDLSILNGIDFFHSILVLQHNPPPIIVDILQSTFDGLNSDGLAFFQVPTYALHYRWDVSQDTDGSVSGGDMEMHLVPQDVVFAVAASAGCVPMEVQPDGYTGIRQGISNTFLFVKPRNSGGSPFK